MDPKARMGGRQRSERLAMTQRKELYEAQLETANAALAARTKLLEGKKFDKKRMQRDPVFRALKAKVNVFKTRLGAIQKVLDLDVATKQRKAEKLATPKAPKEKKKKPVEAAPKKASGKAKAKA